MHRPALSSDQVDGLGGFMRKKMADFLRDPVWQMIGAVVGAVALLVTFYGAGGDDRKSVSVAHYVQTTFPEQWLISDKFKLTHEGNSYGINKTFFDYYLITNDSKTVIKPSDFFEPLTVSFSESSVKIVSVEACSLKYADLYSANNAVKSGAYIETYWERSAASGKFFAKKALLNPGDVACVIVISERLAPASEGEDEIFPVWNARVAGHKLLYYKSRQDYWDSFDKKVEDYFYVGVILENFGIIWFLALFSVIFFYSMRIASYAGYFDNGRWVYKALLMSLAAISTSEILVDIYINNDGNYASEKIHVIVWPLLVLHFILLVYVTVKALRGYRESR